MAFGAMATRPLASGAQARSSADQSRGLRKTISGTPIASRPRQLGSSRYGRARRLHLCLRGRQSCHCTVCELDSEGDTLFFRVVVCSG